MLVPTLNILRAATKGGYAVGAFNVYNLEGIQAVIEAAQHLDSCVILQVHPAALQTAGLPLIDLCLSSGRRASVPVAVHLDHSPKIQAIEAALSAGVQSVMADGSHLDYQTNVDYVAQAVALAHEQSATVEAELGRISGTEDGLTVADFEARMTDPEQAAAYIASTGADMLAVCIGNVHGPYPFPPQLDLERLAHIRQSVDVPLVLHGASGLSADLIQRAIELGICKFNVNTEMRHAYLNVIKSVADRPKLDLVDIMKQAIAAMRTVVEEKIAIFGSQGSSKHIETATLKG